MVVEFSGKSANPSVLDGQVLSLILRSCFHACSDPVASDFFKTSVNLAVIAGDVTYRNPMLL